MAADTQLQLPVNVATRTDVGHLQRELEAVDNFLGQAAIRQPGSPVTLPKTTRLFEETVASNKLNMLQSTDRELLANFLRAIHDKAPILHVSFNTDPSPLFIQKLSTWLRQHIHPYALLQIGLHPSIGAGCVLRTTNKYFDFSLRQRFTDSRELLINQLRGNEATVKPAPATSEAP